VTVLGQEEITNGDEKEEGGPNKLVAPWVIKNSEPTKKTIRGGQKPTKRKQARLSKCFFKTNRNLKV
jgi:hypothetical protein